MRRRWLGGVAALALILAACGGNDNGGDPARIAAVRAAAPEKATPAAVATGALFIY